MWDEFKEVGPWFFAVFVMVMVVPVIIIMLIWLAIRFILGYPV